MDFELDLSTEEFLTALAQEHAQVPRQTDEFTLADWKARSGQTDAVAQRQLLDWVAQGRLTRRRLGREMLYRKAS